MKSILALWAVAIILYPASGLAKESKSKPKNKVTVETPKTEASSAVAKKAITAAESAQAPWNYPPVVGVTQLGEEIQIQVDNDKAMAPEQVFDIDSIQLETEKGEMLGFKTFGNKEPDRHAEFLIDPKIFKLDKVKVVVHGMLMGEWSKLIPIESPSSKKEEAQAKDQGEISNDSKNESKK